jgi:general secretion pathway protein M
MTTGQGAVGSLAPREKQLLGAFGALLGVIVFVVTPYWMWRSLAKKALAVQELRDLAETVKEQESRISAQKAGQSQVLARYSKPAPQLSRYLDEVATQSGLLVSDAADRPEVPHGKKFTERVTVVKLHKVNLLPFVKMMERIAQSPHPVAVSRLSMKPRPGEPDQYEIELALSAYDRKGDPAPAGSAASPKASAAPGARDERDDGE